MSRAAIALCSVAALVVTGAAAYLLWPDRDGDQDSERAAKRAGPAPSPTIGIGTGVAADPAQPVELKLEKPPRAGMLFDIDTGQVLWKRGAGKQLPIASLTKMMTALIITERHRYRERVQISHRAAATAGSKLGVLPVGKKVRLEPLFYGLIMASANDAAVALAEHDSGTVSKFVDRMNREAREMGLSCSHFTTPNGLKNRGNHSCALDLATLARADLADPRIAQVAGTREASFPFPGKIGRLDLYNNHYFLTRGIAGVPGAKVTGLKTGYTIAAGRCYVTTARLGSRQLGVVLLDSPDPLKQVPELLHAGFGGAPRASEG